ncbi:MAG: DUF4093 domain-containing protein [Firmicutes bacterium]|nr:DUF4093 domain-containing protein [Bacillota bacterium]
METKPRLSQIVVVEGRDDQSAVLAAVDCELIVTHGFGIRAETWKRIERAAKGPGIIIFTDPDHAGEEIRRRITERFPEAGQAFLPRAEATKNGDIGIENASPDSIRAALAKVRYKANCGLREATAPASADTAFAPAAEPFTIADLDAYGLSGGPGAAERRAALGKALGIGYGNAKTFLSRLNTYGITREEWNEHGQAVFALRRTENQ